MKKTLLLSFFILLFLLIPAATSAYVTAEENASKTELSTEKIKIYLSERDLTIENAKENAVLEIFSALGTKVLTVELKERYVNLSSLSRGVYIIRIGSFTQKIILQ